MNKRHQTALQECQTRPHQLKLLDREHAEEKKVGYWPSTFRFHHTSRLLAVMEEGVQPKTVINCKLMVPVVMLPWKMRTCFFHSQKHVYISRENWEHKKVLSKKVGPLKIKQIDPFLKIDNL